MIIKPEQLAVMIPTNPDIEEWCKELNKALPKYDIINARRIAGFVSQCAHESRDFTALEENLNYSERALNSVFGRYFGAGKRDAREYARNPEKIANYVYMDEYRRSPLGNVKSGDGWLFRGRGLKQLTGRNNYERFAKDYDMTAEEAAEWLETKEGALASALWFWNTNNLNKVADTGDVRALTKRINGGDIGLEDREYRYRIAMEALTGDFPTRSPMMEVLREGSRGPIVAKMQQIIGVTADGVFGPNTKAALKKWQTKNGLRSDGVAGKNTLQMLFG